MKVLFAILFHFLIINSSDCQTSRFSFRATAEVGYLLNGSKKGLHCKPPFSYTLNTGVSFKTSKKINLGLLINLSYVRYNISYGDNFTLPDFVDILNSLIYETEGLLIGPTVLLECMLSEKTSLSLHSTFLLPATAKTDRYFYSEELGMVTDPLSSREYTQSHLSLQFNVIYDILETHNIEMGLKPFYRYHIQLGSSPYSTSQIFDNLHYLGLGLNFRL